MTDPTLHPDFDLDTALSADLDGALDEYAVELGLAPEDVRAAVAGPDATARRAELAAVRIALGREPDPPGELDEVTRRRLLAAAGVATSPATTTPDRSWMMRAGAAAAVTLIVLGTLYAVVRDSDGSNGSNGSAAKSAGGATSVSAVTGDVGDLGAIDAAEISRLLQGDAGGTTVPNTPGTASDRAFANDSGSGAEAVVVGPEAVDACARQYTAEGRIRFQGRGTYQGRPAVVLGIDTAGRTIVFVVAPDNCTQVLYSASR
jgi:hypothetical protein